MSQADLGIKVGVSSNYVSEIERGRRDGFAVGLLLAMVDALDARVEIVCNVEDGDVKEQDSDLILPMRRLLLPIAHAGDGSSIDETGLTFAKLRKRVLDTTADFNKARYVKLAAEISDLVIAIEAAIGLHEGEAKENLYRLLAHTYILSAQILILLRSEDLSVLAIRSAMDAAENAGDPVLCASAARNYTWAFTRQGMYKEAEKTAVDMAAEIEPQMTKANPEHLAVWGLLLVWASDAAAYSNRANRADELLSLAHMAAVRTGEKLDDQKYGAALDTALIGMKRADNALIGGDAQLVLHIGSEVRRTRSLHFDDWYWHLLVMANAQTTTRDYPKAIETLKEIRQLAPEWLKNHRTAHDVVIKLLGKVSSRRAKSSGLAELATFMGVQP